MSSPNPESPNTPRPAADEPAASIETDVFQYPRTISPAVIGEYMSFDQCPRYFKHRAEEHESSWFHAGGDFTEAFRALNLLLSKAGHDFEDTVLENIATPRCEVTDLQRDVDEFEPDHQFLVDAITEACSRPAAQDQPIIISQASVAGTIGAWNVHGDIDVVFIWPTGSGAKVRVIDIKRATEEKSYHQIQAATYVALLKDVLNEASVADTEVIDVDAGIITKEDTNISPIVEEIPAFDVTPRIMDIKRLLAPNGELQQLSETKFEDVSYQLNQKCTNCPYNESCLTDAYEQGNLRLLGLTVSQQETLASHDIKTVSDVAGLCQPPDDDDWYPTEYRRGRNGTAVYKELATIPGIGELLPTLVYRAQLLEDQLQSTQWPDRDDGQVTDRSGVIDRPRPWVPGSGRCSLPDDEPDDGGPFETEWKNGSMIRVYLNVQQDYLRDRILQVSARVTATASVGDPQRLSITSDGAPDVGSGADKVEKELLHRFIDELYTAIQTVEAGIEYSGIPQDDPLLHCYIYDTTELDSLRDAFERHNSERIGSFQDILEGDAGKDRPMVSVLQPIISQHLQLPTPAVGLLAAYESVHPPTDAYRKPFGKDEWCYDPNDGSQPISLQDVFSYRLFNRTVAGDPEPDDSGSIDPTSGAGGLGIPTRMRYGASVPLGYLWSALGRIDNDWVESVKDEYSLGDYPLDTFRYRDRKQKTHLITPADLKALGRHFCDALEHIERGLTIKDARLKKEPYPIDTLSEASFELPSLADASREYLRIEHSVRRSDEYAHYRMQQSQRLLSGDTLPVQILDIEEVSDQTVYITGRLRYDLLFLKPAHAKAVKRACRVKGGDGSSSGEWMVATPWSPGRTDEVMTAPYDIETGVQSTIQILDLNENHVEFTMKNFWGSDAEFSRSHKSWTTNSGKAQNSPYHVLLEKGEFLFLDPQTDDITAKRIDSALEHADKNTLHNCLEAIRHGQDPAPTTDLFEQNSLNGFSEFMFNEIEPESLPSDEQRSFITAHEAQIVGLQGPPGTGKTDGAFAPALLGRAWGRSQGGLPLAGLITAPSNTAIDELLDSTAELYTDCIQFDSSGALESIELIRIASDKPSDAPDCVTYLDYNDPDDDPELTRLGERLHDTTSGGQGKLSDFGESTESPSTQTLVFATPSRAWKLVNEVTPGNDAKSVASQSVWHLLAVDEASMMTVPQFLLAGASLRSDSQVLVGGDHRQLPPVQKHDWDNERRRSIRSTVPYLSTLDYLRVLRGEEQDVLGEDTAKAWDGQRDPTNVEIPFVQLSTTYRFGHTTANLSQAAIYQQDQIDYTAANPSDPLPAKADSPSSLRTALSSEAPITLITYSATGSYQQSNPIEEAIAAALINARPPNTSAGVVTPHNAQKSRLQTTIFDSDSINATRDTVQIETVNRFQGGEAKLMVLSGTVADPQYIRKEDDFLLTETRVNVAMTRHKQTLVVIAPQSLLGYIPTDTELYDDATIWKKVADWSGEAPTTDESPVWKDTLQSFVHDQDLLSRVPDVEHETEISVYHLSDIESGT